MTPGELAVELRGAPASILKTLAREVRAAGLRAEGQARENVGARLQVRSGQLRRSVQADLVEEGPGALLLRLRAGGGTKELAYARVQELGGTIRPRNGRFLAIPWRGGPALTAGGVGRYASPRDVPGLHFVPTRGGAGGLLIKDQGKGRGARSTIWYVLVRQVQIRGVRYLGDAMDQEQSALGERLAAAVTLALGAP